MSLVSTVLCSASLAGVVAGQTARSWTSDTDQRWNRNANWSGNNQPNASNEIAQFGTGDQLNPELNANNLTVRGLRFSAGANSYNVGDDNGARTLRIGNGSSGFIENLSAKDQAITIATLQFQSDATIRTAGTGGLDLASRLTGGNRDLTFDAAGAISVSGNITTGSGTLTKQGAGDLRLSGSNTYTGLTTVSAGAIVLEASNVFADTAAISIATGASLRLNDLADTIGRVSGDGTIDFGAGGDGRLTLESGTSLFTGSFLGGGDLVVGDGATLILWGDFINPDLNITLAGGTLRLAGGSVSAGELNVTGNSVIDFSGWGDSTLEVDSLGFDSDDLMLSVQNWTNAADFFFSNTGYFPGGAPLDQVRFQGWDAADTKWQAYDEQITPVPEPGTCGALLIGLGSAVILWRRQRRRAGSGLGVVSRG